VVTTCLQSQHLLGRLRQEGWEFKASLDYIVIPCLKKERKGGRQREKEKKGRKEGGREGDRERKKGRKGRKEGGRDQEDQGSKPAPGWSGSSGRVAAL
jgi:hypothetical protein